MVWEVLLDPSGQARLGGPSTLGLQAGSRKRKRVVDEDADSAAGNDDDEEEEDIGLGGSQSSTLGNLTNQLREVYAILKKSTAKGRLLAEQVCFLFSSPSTSTLLTQPY
jgi:mRNA (2'-O-methyladenosine-N6-)-methyltransferase